MSDPSQRIGELRERIDAVDDRIMELLDECARFNAEIGRLKAADDRTPFVPSRELEIFERLESQSAGPFPKAAIRQVFREIISASVALQRGVRVAYLGPRATYSHQAAIQQFGHMAELVSAVTLDEIFERVEAGSAEFGVVPVENSNEGVVSHTLDLFIDSPLTICAEVHVEIHHDLLSGEEDLARITDVYSHPQGLAQCRRWLDLNLRGARQHSTHSTASAAELVAGRVGAAAIASPLAAELYGLRVIGSGIEDNRDNTTRFLVIGQTPPAPGERDATSILFSIKRDLAGALYRALEPFAQNGVNLTRIESRPTRVRAWEYVFFCDFEGHAGEDVVARAIEELRGRCDFVKVLGSYPQARGVA